MKRLTLLLLILCAAPAVLSAKSDDAEFFARVVCADKDVIHTGDSTLVNIYLYSLQPFGHIRILSATPKAKGLRIRQVYFDEGRRRSVTYVGRQAYYVVLCAQYVVTAEQKSVTEFPSVELQADLYYEQKDQRPSRDPFDLFFRQPTYVKKEKKVRSPQLKLRVEDTPLKTTEELLRMGKNVI